MNIHIMTLFPEMVMGGLNTSITGRAISKGILSIEAVNIRDYAFNKHNSVDDYPYGGGAGMLMQAEPVYQCYQAIIDKIHTQGGADSELCVEKKKPRVLYMSPQGQTFTQGMAEELAQEEELIFLCGHYEGIDERVLDEIVTDYVSIGDYVLTGGELPAMVMVDADVQDWCRVCFIMMYLLNSRVFRIICWNTRSIPDRKIWHEKQVPPVLLSGHHANIEKWRQRAVSDSYCKESVRIFWKKQNLTEEDKKVLAKSCDEV